MDASSLQAISSSADLLDAKHPTTLKDAAKQFEALMLNEMLKSVREANPDDGWMGSGGDSGAEIASGLAETEFAKALAQRGGLGLAASIERAVGTQTKNRETTISPTDSQVDSTTQ